eukprot:13648242-Alexandrium_andersonii.AAC.1
MGWRAQLGGDCDGSACAHRRLLSVTHLKREGRAQLPRHALVLSASTPGCSCSERVRGMQGHA